MSTTTTTTADNDDTQKWPCEYCTYLNFPSAQRCTICRSPKSWHLIVTQDSSGGGTGGFPPPPPPTNQHRRSTAATIGESTKSNTTTTTTKSMTTDVIVEGGQDGIVEEEEENNQSSTMQGSDQKSTTTIGVGESLDIFRLASSTTTMVSTTNPIDCGGGDQNVDKWPCSMCTYLNYPRALKCTQCGNRRQESTDSTSINEISSSPPPPSSNRGRESSFVPVGSPSMSNVVIVGGSNRSSRQPSGQHSPNNTSTMIDDQNQQQSSSSSIKIQSPTSISPPPVPPTQQPPPQQNSPTSSTTILDSRIIAKKLQKWTCAACTYENWPKSTRCVMCYHQKGVNPNGAGNNSTSSGRNSASRSPQPGTSDVVVGSADGGGGKDKKRSLSSGKESGRKSPKNSSSSESVNSDHSFAGVASAAATACASSTTTAYIHQGATAAASSSSPSPLLIAASSSCFSPTYSSSIYSLEPQQQQQQNETLLEKTMRRLKKQLRDVDYLWLTALKSIAAGGLADCCDPVEAYLAAGGDPARALTNGEVHVLNRSIPGASYEVAHTLFHLAMRYRREDLLTLLLACSDRPTVGNGGGRPVQRVPCHMSPEAAADIRRQIHMSLRQRKGDMAAYFFTELATFSLPSTIYDLPPSIQAKLFDALLDRNVQKKLEEEYPIINWSVEVTDRLGSRLFALWNRMCGDCLLDSVLQATWGVFDSENSLRQALADSLSDAANIFYPRWREYETYLAHSMHFTIEEDQFARDWDLILQLASKPGAALEQAHIFVLAHIIRRPIIVYGVRVVKSYYSNESIDYARFEGIYLPLLWEPNFCWRSPICLSYTPGHFTALVPMEPDAYELGAIAHVRELPQQPRFVYLPLKESDGRPLPMHFLNANERGHEQALLRVWLDVCVTDGGLWCCKMRIHRLSPSVQQMIDDWLDYYRRLSQLHQAASQALTRYSKNAINDGTSQAASSSSQQILKSTRINTSISSSIGSKKSMEEVIGGKSDGIGERQQQEEQCDENRDGEQLGDEEDDGVKCKEDE